MKYDVFLSYAREDRNWVKRLAEALSKKGLRVFLDQTEINPAKPVFKQLEKGLRESEFIIPIVSAETLSPNQAFEFGAALASDHSLIAVVSDGVARKAIPGPSRRRAYLPKGDPFHVAEQIARGISEAKNGNSGKKKASRSIR